MFYRATSNNVRLTNQAKSQTVMTHVEGEDLEQRPLLPSDPDEARVHVERARERRHNLERVRVRVPVLVLGSRRGDPKADQLARSRTGRLDDLYR
jgi:hypothetical protein